MGIGGTKRTDCTESGTAHLWVEREEKNERHAPDPDQPQADHAAGRSKVSRSNRRRSNMTQCVAEDHQWELSRIPQAEKTRFSASCAPNLDASAFSRCPPAPVANSFDVEPAAPTSRFRFRARLSHRWTTRSRRLNDSMRALRILSG